MVRICIGVWSDADGREPQTSSSMTCVAPSVDLRQEKVNAATHALAFLLALAGAALIVWAAARHGGVWQICGCSLYAATLVCVYLISTLSHAVHRPGPRHALRIADQAMIFLFIAGSYTPIALVWLRSGSWWVLHVLFWSVALAGFASKAIFAHRVRPGAVSVAPHLLLGWMPLVMVGPLVATLPWGLCMWVVAGALCYTAGIVFFCCDHRVRYFHAAWHVLVIAGSACHYAGILIYCTRAAASIA